MHKTLIFTGAAKPPSLFLAALTCAAMSFTAVAQEDDSLDALFADTQTESSDSSDKKENSAQATSSTEPAQNDEPEQLDTIPVRSLSGDEQPSAAPRRAPRQIEEIVVTATKRESSVRDIPVSIDAMSGDALSEAGATDLEQILAQSPGVTFSSSGGSEVRQQVVMRGITTSGTASYGGSTTGFLFNDVSLVNPSLAGAVPTIDPYDLGTVEVLKGPQGTLFGGAALAGAIRYVPKQPEFGEFSGALAAGLGHVSDSDDLGYEYTGHVNVPVGEAAAVRIVGTRREFAGFIDDNYAEEDDINSGQVTQARIIGAWDISERLATELMAYRYEATSDASGATDNPDRRETDSRRRTTPGEVWANIYRGQMEYDFDAFTLTGIASFIEKDNNSIYDLTSFWGLEDVPGLQVWQLYEGHTEQTTGEVRIVSSEPSSSGFAVLDSWQYLLGLYWLDADQVFNNTTLANFDIVDPLEVINIPSDVSAVAEETAVFFDISRPLGDRLELTLGGRYFRQQSTGYLGDGSEPDGVDLAESGFNPKAALTWHATDNIRVLTSYAKGFRFGGFNNNPLRDPDIEFTYYSDEINNYELGMRTDWWGGGLRYDLTGFYIEWKNPQVRQSSQTTSTSFISNAGGARVLGVETSLTAMLPPSFMLTINGSYVDARLTEEFESSRGTAESGKSLPATPRFTGMVSLMHEGNIGRWTANSGVSYSYQGSSKNEAVNYETLPAYGLLGAFISARREGRLSPTIRISGTNLLDETVALNAFHGISALGGSINYGTLRPRTVTLSLGLEF